ncbi:hypothetical protein DXX93_06440 [Thalassotalea euphylliae]|uniref:Uncharacterized protein n=1 Tax=Thalassotalea euphylliae TaxID=1655234 RepID=A0A3E0TP27_9GAMM|nr:hypothetical protein [Thalassotalea euphylliae]REL26258.1 hypothetical protein DXX93_06440 [Thalassotalea euphylliae]
MSKVGIFWYVQRKLIYKCTLASSQVADELGLIDAPFTHLEEWEEQKLYRKFSLSLEETEYQQYPRGRVVFDTKDNRAKVFIDKSIFSRGVCDDICGAFQLDATQVKWFSDPHYRVFGADAIKD